MAKYNSNNKKETIENEEVCSVNQIDIAKYLIDEYDRVKPNEIIKKYSFTKSLFTIMGSNRIACFRDKTNSELYLLLLYSDSNKYSIVITPTYIGGGMSCRYHEPLEDWTRGHDLLDGKCTEHTLNSILMYMLKDELITINK